MKLATTTADFASYTSSQTEAMEYIRQAGFKYVDYNFGTDYNCKTGIFGTDPEKHIEAVLKKADELGVEVEFFQSNHEGALVDRIQEAYGKTDGIVMNPAAYTHTSVAILDAVKAVGIPTVEVHISDPDTRDEFRKISFVRAACIATVKGKGLLIQLTDHRVAGSRQHLGRNNATNGDAKLLVLGLDLGNKIRLVGEVGIHAHVKFAYKENFAARGA